MRKEIKKINKIHNYNISFVLVKQRLLFQSKIDPLIY